VIPEVWMPWKRDVLEQLKRDELLASVDRFELPVEDRRIKNALVETLTASRNAGLAVILADLSRDRLKELCRALGLDDSGREKAAIVARLVGEVPAALPAAEAALPIQQSLVPPARGSQVTPPGMGRRQRGAGAGRSVDPVDSRGSGSRSSPNGGDGVGEAIAAVSAVGR
jgi:type I restriction enzyme M protein